MSEECYGEAGGFSTVGQKGYALSLEAVSAIMLLLMAVSTFELFQFPRENAHAFFTCSDSAIALSKTHAFSDGSLAEKVGLAGALSGLCIEANSPLASASSCGGATNAGEKFSFSIPVWQAGTLQDASVSCWQGQ